MNRYLVIGMIGLLSGILCARADVPLAWSGRKGDPVDARSLGKPAAWWTEVPETRFDKAFWLSCIGQPGTYLTMWMLAALIGSRNPALALALKINTFIGAYTGLFFHGSVCTKAVVYRRLAGKLPGEDAAAAVDSVGTILIPLRKCGVKLGGAMGIGFSLFAIVLMCAGAAVA